VSKGTVLVVDDEPNARRALAELLREEGYTVETAPDGRQALGAIEKAAPDLLLTDLRMPVMGGLELIERIRSRGGDMALVVMTASDASRESLRASMGVQAGYITKPVRLGELIRVLDCELARWRTRCAPAG
jgi:CheY-like chemotaxis protein